MRAALVRASVQPLLAERIEWARSRLRQQTETMFGPELAAMDNGRRRAVGAALDTLSQFESAEHLRVARGYTLAQTTDILRRSFLTLLS
jgi:hypothetical protein